MQVPENLHPFVNELIALLNTLKTNFIFAEYFDRLQPLHTGEHVTWQHEQYGC